MNKNKRKHALGNQDSVPEKHKFKFVPEVILELPIDRYHKRVQGDTEAQYVQHTASNLKKTLEPKRELTLAEKEEEQEKFHRFLSFFSQLDSLERDIIRLRFGLDGKRPKTLAEVGALLHFSHTRIHQIQNQALAKLRDMVREYEEGENETEESD